MRQETVVVMIKKINHKLGISTRNRKKKSTKIKRAVTLSLSPHRFIEDKRAVSGWSSTQGEAVTVKTSSEDSYLRAVKTSSEDN